MANKKMKKGAGPKSNKRYTSLSLSIQQKEYVIKHHKRLSYELMVYELRRYTKCTGEQMRALLLRSSDYVWGSEKHWTILGVECGIF
jgi:hypothetical protein